MSMDRAVAPPRPASPPARQDRRAGSTTAWRRLRHPDLSPYAWRLLGITAAALALRVVILGHQPLWRDEAFTELASQRSWAGMLDAVRHDSAPPLSYVLTHLATSISTSSWYLRMPAALAGTLAIPLAAAIGRRIGGDRVALCAAGVYALAPGTLIGARDARMYALAGTLVLAALLALWRALEDPTRGRLALLAGAVAAALLTQYLTTIAITAMAIAAVVWLRPARPAVLRCGAAMLGGVLPLLLWLPAAAPQLSHAGASFWVEPVSGASLLGVLTEFLCGPPVDQGIPHRALVQVLQAGAILLGGIAGIVAILHTALRAPRREQVAAAFVATAGLLAIAIIIAVSLLKPILDARYAGVLEPPLTIMLGVGVGRIRPPRLASLPLGAMGAASAGLVWFALRSDIPPLTAQLGTAPAPDEIVLAHREVYLQTLLAEPPAFRAATHVPDASLDWFWGVAIYPENAYLPSVPASVTRVDELTESDVPNQRVVPPDFRAVSTTCSTNACLTVWTR